MPRLSTLEHETTRPLGPSDVDAIAAIHAESWRVTYRGILADAFLDGDLLANRRAHWSARLSAPSCDDFGFLVEVAGQPAGFVFAFGAHDAAWGTLVDNLHVRTAFQGRGLGSMLLAAAAEGVRARYGDAGVFLWVYEQNTRAQAFYGRVGGRRQDRAVVDVEGGSQVAQWRYAWPSAESLARQLARGREASAADPPAAQAVPNDDDGGVTDRSHGWDAVAPALIAGRQESRIGAEVIRAWAHTLPRAAAVLDLGCGSGVPVSEALLDAGCRVWGIDASPRLVAAFRSRFPNAPAACEPAEDSTFFDRTFDAVVAVGLVFLLSESAQRQLLARVAKTLAPGGQFMFTAPRLPCTWTDAWTSHPSRSLGFDVYRTILGEGGLVAVGTHLDEGGNDYLQLLKAPGGRACFPSDSTER